MVAAGKRWAHNLLKLRFVSFIAELYLTTKMIPDQKTLSVCSLGELWLEGAEAGYDSMAERVEEDKKRMVNSIDKISSMFW